MQEIIRFLKRVKDHITIFFITNEYWQAKVQKKYNLQQGLPVIELDELLPNFEDEVKMSTFSFSNSLFTDYALIKGLCRKFENCKYFEIGTWKGESVANAAAVSEKAVTLNLSSEELRAFNLPEEYINLMGHFSKDIPNVVHLKGNSRTYDFEALNEKFDVVFIDGDHHYEMVKIDTENVFKHLIHENSIVIWHDYGFNPEQVRHEVFLGILDGLPQELHKNVYHVSNTSAAVYLKGNYNTKTLKKYATPNRSFKINIKSFPLDNH